MEKNIVLMGIKHCGKSTQGKMLAEKLKIPFYDTDDVLKEISGKSAREIFASEGEQAFKEAEVKACSFIAEKKEKCIVSTGGGICNNKEALDILHVNGIFVFLNAEESICAGRIFKKVEFTKDGKMLNLPAYIANKNPNDESEARLVFHSFYCERVKVYKSLADLTIDMADRTKTENARCLYEEVKALG
jgi:shikimate kinase